MTLTLNTTQSTITENGREFISDKLNHIIEGSRKKLAEFGIKFESEPNNYREKLIQEITGRIPSEILDENSQDHRNLNIRQKGHRVINIIKQAYAEQITLEIAFAGSHFGNTKEEEDLAQKTTDFIKKLKINPLFQEQAKTAPSE